MRTSVMRSKLLLIRALVVVATFSGGMSGFCVNLAPGSPESNNAPVQFSTSSAEVLKLTEARVDAEVIKAYLKSSKAVTTPSAIEIIALKDRGVHDDVITALLERAAQLNAQQVAPQPINPADPLIPGQSAPAIETYAPGSDSNAPPADTWYAYPYPVYSYAYPGYSYWYDPIWPYFWPAFYWGYYPYRYNCFYGHNYPCYGHYGYYPYRYGNHYYPYQRYSTYGRPYAYQRYGNQVGNVHGMPNRYASGRYSAGPPIRGGGPPVGYAGQPGTTMSSQHVSPSHIGGGFQGAPGAGRGGGHSMGGGRR